MVADRFSRRVGPWTRALAMFVLAAFTLFVGWLMVYNGMQQIDYAERTLANAEPAVARVVSIEARELPGEDHGEFRYIAHVVFETEAASAEAELPQVNAESDHQVGEAVDILYDRTDPSAILLDRDDILVNPSISLFAGIAAGVIALAIVIVGFRYRYVDGRAIAAGALSNS